MPREQMQSQTPETANIWITTQNDAIGIQGKEIIIKSLEERIKYIALTYGWLKS